MSKVMPKAYRPEIAKEVARADREGWQVTEVAQIDYWVVAGTSRWGRLIRRDGKFVSCGHKHRTKAAALRCLPKTTRLQPGNCARYEVQRREGFAIRRVKK
jgi:hypothetical protein